MAQGSAVPTGGLAPRARDTGLTWSVLSKIYDFLAKQENHLEQTFGEDLHAILEFHCAHDGYEFEGRLVPPREIPEVCITVVTDLPIQEQVELRAKVDALWRSSLHREQDFTATIRVRPKSTAQTAPAGNS